MKDAYGMVPEPRVRVVFAQDAKAVKSLQSIICEVLHEEDRYRCCHRRRFRRQRAIEVGMNQMRMR